MTQGRRAADQLARLGAVGLPSSFCPIPWVHAHAGPSGHVLPCCVYQSSMPESAHLSLLSNIDQLMDLQSLRSMRLAMLAGEPDQGCCRCYQREQAGLHSKRLRGLDSVSDSELRAIKSCADMEPDGSLRRYDLRHFDFRWENTCNLKCRSCWAGNSSRIAAEESAQGLPSRLQQFDGDVWRQEFLQRITEARTIYFAGGEPLLMRQHWELLQALLAAGRSDVDISYSSNLTTLQYRDQSITAVWQQFANLRVSVSIDHHGAALSYLRHGCSWQQIVDNVRRVQQESPHVKLQIDCVISVLNACDLADILTAFADTFGDLPVYGIMISGKSEMDPRHLPVDLKAIALARLRSWCDQHPQRWDGIAIAQQAITQLQMPRDERQWQLLQQNQRRLDAWRGERMAAVLPELATALGMP